MLSGPPVAPGATGLGSGSPPGPLDAEGPAHFLFPDLSEELDRIDRPWRRLWGVCAVLGLGAAVVGAVLLYAVARSPTSGPNDWVGPLVLLACLVPAGLALGALGGHPVPPTEAWVSSEGMALGGPTRPPVRWRWADRRRPLLLCDLRSTGPRWRRDGSPRTVDFILARTAGTLRTPLPAGAVEAMLRAAEAQGYAVRSRRGEFTQQGFVRLTELVPPRHGR